MIAPPDALEGWWENPSCPRDNSPILQQQICWNHLPIRCCEVCAITCPLRTWCQAGTDVPPEISPMEWAKLRGMCTGTLCESNTNFRKTPREVAPLAWQSHAWVQRLRLGTPARNCGRWMDISRGVKARLSCERGSGWVGGWKMTNGEWGLAGKKGRKNGVEASEKNALHAKCNKIAHSS